MQDAVYDCYLRNLSRVNNWNLVDGSAPYILGPYLVNRKRSVLYNLAKSKILWERRIAVVATMTFIRAGDFKDALALIRLMLDDDHDLMHKACGWMLREIGKRDTAVLEKFLDENWAAMPRTMLRYAIERFPAARRLEYLRRKPKNS
jgi:3-methyladenine DNA glycosylase AlkD